MDDLPTLPAVAVRLLNATLDPDSSLEDVASLIRGDQSLTAKLLSLANSVKYASHQPVGTVEKAVSLLGFKTVRCVVLTTKVFECFNANAGPESGGFDRVEFWKHAFAVAVASRQLAAETTHLGIDPSDAFVAGLLHDLGKVALDAVFPKAYARVAMLAADSYGDIADAERQLLGVDHTVAGRRIAERWNLPAQLQEVIWLHHLMSEALPGRITARNLIGIVQLADTLVRELHIGNSGNYLFLEHSETIASRLGVRPETRTRVTESLGGEVAEWVALLGLDAETPASVYLSALARGNAELGRLYDEVVESNRRLAASSRYFRAIGLLDSKLSAEAETAAVVREICVCSGEALQRHRTAAFGVRWANHLLDLAWRDRHDQPVHAATRPLPDELRDWLADPGVALDALAFPPPPALGRLLHDLGAAVDDHALWLLPIAHERRIIGGVLVWSDADERERLITEADDLRSLLTSLGLALTRAESRASARRLADDLAENNRRLQQMQAELLRSRTLASIAEIASGAGHELNGPLAVISGRAQMLQREITNEEQLQALKLVVDKAHDCSQIVRELMDFAKPPPLRAASVALGPLLKAVRERWLEAVRFGPARFSLSVPDDLPTVMGDVDQLNRVFDELIKNALDATARNEGAIVIHARATTRPGFVEVIVEDRGEGMDSAVLQRVFDPFFSHRPAGRGRGLGLPRAYRIVDSHGGKMWIESHAGDGAKVHFTLPIAAAEDVPSDRPG